MLADVRTYTVRPGTLKKQLALYAKHGFVPQKRHFGEPLAYLTADVGDVNTYLHIWVYEDAADRAAEALGQRDAHHIERGGQFRE